MDYFLNDDESDNDMTRKLFIFSNPRIFSCYHARLRAGIFKFSRTPQTVFPIQKKEALIQALLPTTLGLRPKVSGPQSGPFFRKIHEFI